MQIILLPEAEKDLNFWRKTGNKKVLEKISKLVESTLKTPFEGLGKPEPLKYLFSGMWSRRINREHRFIYEIKDDIIVIHSLKGHYKK